MQQSIGKRRLPMIDMGNNAEIPDMRYIHLLKLSPVAWNGKLNQPVM